MDLGRGKGEGREKINNSFLKSFYPRKGVGCLNAISSSPRWSRGRRKKHESYAFGRTVSYFCWGRERGVI